MYCSKCGKEIADGDAFCSTCGSRNSSNYPNEQNRSSFSSRKMSPEEESAKDTLNACYIVYMIFFAVAGLIMCLGDIGLFFNQTEWYNVPTGNYHTFDIGFFNKFMGFLFAPISLLFIDYILACLKPYKERNFSSLSLSKMLVISAVELAVFIVIYLFMAWGLSADFGTGIYFLLFAVVVFRIIISVLHIKAANAEKGAEYLSEHKTNDVLNKIKSDEPEIAEDFWTCKACGTVNERINSYCKDCGRYK